MSIDLNKSAEYKAKAAIPIAKSLISDLKRSLSRALAEIERHEVNAEALSEGNSLGNSLEIWNEASDAAVLLFSDAGGAPSRNTVNKRERILEALVYKKLAGDLEDIS